MIQEKRKEWKRDHTINPKFLYINAYSEDLMILHESQNLVLNHNDDKRIPEQIILSFLWGKTFEAKNKAIENH